MATAQHLRIRLFLEGVEVPVIAMNLQAQSNAPLAATIQIPPLAEGTRLFPRTLVHVFFSDFYEAEDPTTYNRADAQKDKGDPSVYEKSVQRPIRSDGVVDPASRADSTYFVPDYLNEHYKLLFVGEIVGFQWTKNVNGRSLLLQCTDLSNYWDSAKQYNNTDLFGPGMKAMFSGGSTNLFTDFLDEPGGVIAHLIQSPSTQYPGLKGLLGGVVHLLEALGGSYYTDKKYAGQNIFYSIAELRLHITQMITALEDDPTGARLLNVGGFGDMLGRSLGQLGAEASFRDCINMLMRHIFHETYAQPAPHYSPGLDGTISGFVRKKLKDDPKYTYIIDAAKQVVAGVDDINKSFDTLVNPQQVLLPNGNPVNASNPVVASALQTSVLARISGLKKICSATAARARATGFHQIISTFVTTGQDLTAAAQKANTIAKSGANQAVLNAVSYNINTARAKMVLVQDADQPLTPRNKAVPARLNQQIFRPDVWFSAPPRCNVIFPDHYTLFEYQRDFMKEPTRLMLKTSDSFFGEDELFDNFYFAPKAFGLKRKDATLQSLLSNDVLDHELFVGIIPVFEKMGEVNIFGVRSGTVKGKMPKVGLAQRSTNFLYFKYRFAARAARVQMRFNPYLAAGFPAVVLDKYVDIQTVIAQNNAREKIGQPVLDTANTLGTHFLGNISELNHVLDQGHGGTTTVGLGYPRQTDEGVEFLGAIEQGQTVRRRFAKDAFRTTDVAALAQPGLGTLGPNYGVIVSVQDVTSKYKPSADGIAQELPLYKGVRKKGPPSQAKVDVGISQRAGNYGPDAVELAGGNPARLLFFRAYQVKEEVPRYRQEQVDLPAEEYIRPGWYGDIWHPSNIGGAYQQFFQTGSITDPQQIGDPGGATTGNLNQDARDAVAQAAQGLSSSDPKNEAPAILSLDKDSTIQQSVEFLVMLYSYIKQADIDVDQFIKAYTWRPVASMVDMFGSFDLELDAQGHDVIKGVEGFHSRAFGPYDDLFGLVTPDIESIVGIKRGTTAAARGDTRKRKREAVLAYITSLTLGPAILG